MIHFERFTTFSKSLRGLMTQTTEYGFVDANCFVNGNSKPASTEPGPEQNNPIIFVDRFQ